MKNKKYICLCKDSVINFHVKCLFSPFLRVSLPVRSLQIVEVKSQLMCFYTKSCLYRLKLYAYFVGVSVTYFIRDISSVLRDFMSKID